MSYATPQNHNKSHDLFSLHDSCAIWYPADCVKAVKAK